MVDWRISDGPVAYAEAVAAMEAQVAGIRAGREAERVWLLEHPPLYTGGTSADPAELLDPDRFPIFASGRGGRYTYPGPGQRIAYVMLDLGLRGRDVRGFVPTYGWLALTTTEDDQLHVSTDRGATFHDEAMPMRGGLLAPDGRDGVYLARENGFSELLHLE